MAATFIHISSNVTNCHRCHELTPMLARIGKVTVYPPWGQAGLAGGGDNDAHTGERTLQGMSRYSEVAIFVRELGYAK